MISKLISITIILTSLFFAQEFRVENYITEGELTSEDLSKENFGRYDGYQIPFNKGEEGNFYVYSEDFQPALVLVSPSGEVLQNSFANSNDASISLNAVITGDYILYVLDRKNGLGKYSLINSFANESASKVSKLGFCESISYVLAHSDANFILLNNKLEELKLQKFLELKNIFIEEKIPSLIIELIEGDKLQFIENIYNERLSQLKKCLTNFTFTEPVSKFEEILKISEFSKKTGNEKIVLRITLIKSLTGNNYKIELEVFKSLI